MQKQAIDQPVIVLVGKIMTNKTDIETYVGLAMFATGFLFFSACLCLSAGA